MVKREWASSEDKIAKAFETPSISSARCFCRSTIWASAFAQVFFSIAMKSRSATRAFVVSSNPCLSVAPFSCASASCPCFV